MCDVSTLKDLLPIAGQVWFSLFVPTTNDNQFDLMKNFRNLILTTASLLSLATLAHADDSVAGKWTAQFDSQVGQQRYTYEFKVDGTNLTGHATGMRDNGTNDVDIVDGKINGDTISFAEPMKMQDNDVRVEYTGKLAGDELKLHRKVGDFAEYDIVAKRAKDGTAAASADTNSPSSK